MADDDPLKLMYRNRSARRPWFPTLKSAPTLLPPPFWFATPPRSLAPAAISGGVWLGLVCHTPIDRTPAT